MKILFGTGNRAKLSVLKPKLEMLGVELIGLQDLQAEGKAIPKVIEDGSTPLENARQKAMAYYEAFQMPVFSCDSGLYFDNVPSELQPGVHVRTVNGKYLSDSEMVEHYAGLVHRFGMLQAKYKNAICFVWDRDHVFEAMDDTLESEAFLITDQPHSAIRKQGFPIDSMSLECNTKRYYYDLPEVELERLAVTEGILAFFQQVFTSLEENANIKVIL